MPVVTLANGEEDLLILIALLLLQLNIMELCLSLNELVIALQLDLLFLSLFIIKMRFFIILAIESPLKLDYDCLLAELSCEKLIR